MAVSACPSGSCPAAARACLAIQDPAGDQGPRQQASKGQRVWNVDHLLPRPAGCLESSRRRSLLAPLLLRRLLVTAAAACRARRTAAAAAAAWNAAQASAACRPGVVSLAQQLTQRPGHRSIPLMPCARGRGLLPLRWRPRELLEHPGLCCHAADSCGLQAQLLHSTQAGSPRRCRRPLAAPCRHCRHCRHCPGCWADRLGFGPLVVGVGLRGQAAAKGGRKGGAAQAGGTQAGPR